MKPDRLQRPKVALQIVFLLILQDSQEERPHAFEIPVHDQPVQDINSLTEIEEQNLHVISTDTVSAYNCIFSTFRYRHGL